MLFALGEHEVLIIVLVFVFLILGVPTLAVIAARLSSGLGFRLRRWIASKFLRKTKIH